jgi:hypothetical protein
MDGDKTARIIASKMTMIPHMGKQVEWVFVLDTFNNEIIASALATRPGDSRPYFACLNQLHRKKKSTTLQRFTPIKGPCIPTEPSNKI